jgi:hypothetical protein
VTRIFNGTWTATVSGLQRSQNALLFDVTGYLGAPIITGCRDKLNTPIWTGSLPPPDNSSFAGTDYICLQQAGETTPFAITYNHRVIFNCCTSFVPPFTPPTNLPTFVYNFDGDLIIPWYHVIPHRTYCSLRATYNLGTAEFTPAPGESDFGMPFIGAAVYNMQGDNRWGWTQNARTFLIKVAYQNGNLIEKWRQDISHTGPVVGSFPGALVTPIDGAVFDPLYCEPRWCGRFIFVPRSGQITITTSVSPFSEQVSYPTLEVYDAANPVGTSLTTTVFLNPANSPADPSPVLQANYGGVPSKWNVTQGVDHNSKEWILIQAVSASHVVQKWLVTFDPAHPGNPPVVTYSNAVNDGLPDLNDMQGMAQAADEYLWTNDVGSVAKKAGG